MNYFRHPKTRQERAQERTEYVRAKRRKANVPCERADRIPGATKDRSWKQKRKTQYRLK